VNAAASTAPLVRARPFLSELDAGLGRKSTPGRRSSARTLCDRRRM